MSQQDLEYLEFKDEYLHHYENGTVTKVVLDDGTLVDTSDPQFCVPGKFGLLSKPIIPNHLEVKEVPLTKLYENFEDYLKVHCGFEVVAL